MTATFAKPLDYAARPALERLRTRPAGVVRCGACVTIRRGILMSDVRIVPDEEADPRHGRIAESSPLSQVLLGARLGDAVDCPTGGRTEQRRILAIAHPE